MQRCQYLSEELTGRVAASTSNVEKWGAKFKGPEQQLTFTRSRPFFLTRSILIAFGDNKPYKFCTKKLSSICLLSRNLPRGWVIPSTSEKIDFDHLCLLWKYRCINAATKKWGLCRHEFLCQASVWISHHIRWQRCSMMQNAAGALNPVSHINRSASAQVWIKRRSLTFYLTPNFWSDSVDGL